jgi:hypothetical protein
MESLIAGRFKRITARQGGVHVSTTLDHAFDTSSRAQISGSVIGPEGAGHDAASMACTTA